MLDRKPVRLFLLILITCGLVQSRVKVSRGYYTVAILEHEKFWNTTTHSPREIILENLKYYTVATEEAKKKDADIIVFPEYGLYPLLSRKEMKNYLETIPDPNSADWNPCIQRYIFKDKPMLYTLSCLAKKHSIYIVANVGDIQPCNHEEDSYCPSDGTFHYNANVVIDRMGTIVSRYRKEHLFFEAGMDLPHEPQNPVFKTDFGIFAHFICFDIVFKHMVDVALDPTIDAVMFSTLWYSSIPFYNSIQVFQSWAVGTNTTLIAANCQGLKHGVVGSGIFTPNSSSYTFNPDGRSKLLVARTARRSSAPIDDHLSMMIITSNGTKSYQENSTDFGKYLPEFCSNISYDLHATGFQCTQERIDNINFAKLKYPSGYVQTCNHGMCCSLNYSTDGLEETYYLGVANTTHNAFDRYYWCEEKCILVRCEDDGGMTCKRLPTESYTVFDRFLMTANFTTRFVHPYVSRRGLRSAEFNEWNYKLKDGDGGSFIGSLAYTKQSNSKPLLSATLLGRCYNRDPPYIR